jgi:Cep192 domain 4
MRRCAFVLIASLVTVYFSACGGSNQIVHTTSSAARLSAYSLTYGTVAIGATSAAQTVALTNSGDATLTISSIAPSANFTETDNCSGSVAAGATCSINVSFAPTTAGDLTGSITISDGVPGGPLVISLSGTGKLAGVTLSGVATKSAVNGATVTVYAVNADGTNGAVLGTGTTDANGAFSVTLSTTPTGPVRVVVTGGTYVSEADGSTVTSRSDVSALVDDASSSVPGMSITAVSTFVDSLTSGLLAAGGTTIVKAHGSAETTINGFYGFPTGTKVEELLAKFKKADITGDPSGFLLGMIVGALAEEGKILHSSDPDILIEALAADIFDGKWDGKKGGTPVPFGGGTLPTTAGTTDFLSDLATYVATGTTPTTEGITTSDVSSLEDMLGSSVSTSPTTPAAVGLAATSSGAINSLAFGGNQYLFVAARSEGVVVVDITDPTAATPMVKAWPQISSNTTGGFSGADVGGIVPFVGTAGHPQVLAFSYGSKHVVVLNAQTLVSGTPGTDNPVDAEMDVPLVATSPVSFSGGSAYIGSGVPLGGSLLALATADGYMIFDASQVGPSGNPIVKLYPVDDPNEIIAENMGADIPHGILLGGNESGGVQLIDLSAGATSGTSYYILPNDFLTVFPGSSTSDVDGDAADSALQVGILTFEDTNDVEFVNLANITKTVSTTSGVLNSWAPAAGGTAHINLTDPAGSNFIEISGSAVDSTTHLAQFMAGYSSDFAAGMIQDPNSVPSGGTWQGMSDWVFLNLNTYISSYSEALDPHADGVVYNLLKGATYGYVLDGSAHGVVQTDLAGLMAIPRAGTTGDPAHQPSADPTAVTNTTTGGKVMREITW